MSFTEQFAERRGQDQPASTESDEDDADVPTDNLLHLSPAYIPQRKHRRTVSSVILLLLL